jgi:hypothetical protein
LRPANPGHHSLPRSRNSNFYCIEAMLFAAIAPGLLSWPFAHCAKAILCPAPEHSQLLIVPRPVYALCWRTPICSSCQGHHCFIVAPSWCAIKLCAVRFSSIRNPPASRCWALIQASPMSIPIVIAPRLPFAAVLLCFWQCMPHFFAKIPLEQDLPRLFCCYLSVMNMISIECS